MKNFLLAFAVITSILFYSTVVTSQDFSANYDAVVDGVVEIHLEFENGYNLATGFYFEDRHVITSAHTFATEKEITKTMICGNDYPSICVTDIDVVYLDPRQDIAILEIGEEDWNLMKPQENPKVLPISGEITKIGSEIFGIGNRSGFLYQIYSGNIAMTYQMDDEDVGIHYIDAEILKGDSGGPVFNTKNEVVGIAKSYLIPDENAEHIEQIVTNMQLRKAIIDWKAGIKPMNNQVFSIMDSSALTWDHDENFIYKIVQKNETTTFLDKFGIVVGDGNFVVSIKDGNAMKISDDADMRNILNQAAEGDEVTMEWERDGKMMKKTVTVRLN